MDLFTLNLDGSRGPQIHDFNFGIPPSGLFWTGPVPEFSVEGELDDGFASFSVTNLAQLDAKNLDNSLHGGPTVPAAVSFDMRWRGTGSPFDFTSSGDRFTGRFQFATVTIKWSARTRDFRFMADPAGTTVTQDGIIGEERNGVFF
jgi:hypothetical protein